MSAALNWTDKLLDEAEKAWIKGRSGQLIADMLGRPFTRSAVCGQANRRGWKRAPGTVVVGVGGAILPSQSARARRARGELPPIDQTPRPAKVCAPPRTPSPPRPIAPPQPVVSLVHARPFMSRALGECPWLLDDGRSCCGPVARGSYCAGHAALVYRPVKTLDANKMARKFG